MKKDFTIFLRHILECINRIEEYVNGMKEEDFSSDSKTHDAVLRRLEIIGEAVKQIPEDLKEKYSHIPWKEFAGLRDILIHKYFGVDLHLTFQVIQKDLPKLKEEIHKILNQLEAESYEI